MFLGEEEKKISQVAISSDSIKSVPTSNRIKKFGPRVFGRNKTQKSIELVKKFPLNFEIDLNRFLRFWAMFVLLV